MPLIHNVCREFLTTEVNKLEGLIKFYKLVREITDKQLEQLSAREKEASDQERETLKQARASLEKDKEILLMPFENIYQLVGDQPETCLREQIGMSFSGKNKDGEEQDSTEELAHKLLNYMCSPLFSTLRLASATICNKRNKIEATLQNYPIPEATYRTLMNCLIMPVQIASNAAMYKNRFYDALQELVKDGNAKTEELKTVIDLFFDMAGSVGQYINMMTDEKDLPKQDPRFVYGNMISLLVFQQENILKALYEHKHSLDDSEQRAFDKFLEIGFAHLNQLVPIIDAGSNATSNTPRSRKAIQVHAESGDILQGAIEAKNIFDDAAKHAHPKTFELFNELLKKQTTLMKKEFRGITAHFWGFCYARHQAIQRIMKVENAQFVDGSYRIPTSHIPVEQNLLATGAIIPSSPRSINIGSDKPQARGRSSSAAGALLKTFKRKVSEVVRSLKEEKEDCIVISPSSSPRPSESSTSSQLLFASPPGSPRSLMSAKKGIDPLIAELQEHFSERASDSPRPSTPNM